MNLAMFHKIKLDLDDLDYGLCQWEGNIFLPDGISITEEIIIEAIEKDKQKYTSGTRLNKMNCLIDKLAYHEISFTDQIHFLWIK